VYQVAISTGSVFAGWSADSNNFKKMRRLLNLHPQGYAADRKTVRAHPSVCDGRTLRQYYGRDVE
jgi:hypothetical protein